MPLNDRLVRYTKPTDKLQYLNDGGGLYLLISPAGTRTWSFRNQTAGTRGWLKLGRYPAMPLAEARFKAKELLATGLQAARTVAWAYSEYTPHLRRSYASWREIDRRLRKDVLPELGEKRLYQLSKADCAAALQKVVTRGAAVLANRTLSDLKHFLDYCVDQGWLQGNPAAGINRRSVGGRERSRERALSFEELERFIPAVRRFNLPTQLALGLILLTGQRPSEVLGYSESERYMVWWTIPATRAKNGREQKVYLSPQARHLLRRAVQLYGRRPFQFDHRTLSKAVSRLGWDPPFTPHDLRRTMATRLGDLGIMPHVVEKMLNHQMEGAMAVYNRNEFLADRQAAWRLWGAKLAQLRRKHHANLAVTATHRLRGRGVHATDPGGSGV